MPQPPSASQPASFSVHTPGPSRFCLTNSRHARGTSTGDGHPPVEGQTSAARPTPRSRFAPSWLQHQTPAQTQTQTPVPAAHKFRIASARRTLYGGGDDAIEDGSSPVGTPEAATDPFARQIGPEETSVLVVRESPTATRVAKVAAAVPSKRLRRQRAGPDPEDDIEDAPVDIGNATADERDDEIDAMMPDSVADELATTKTNATVATPVPQGASSLTRQQTSAARLLSSIQPLKRRRLFVPPALITSSPPEPGQGQGEAGTGEDDSDMHSEAAETDEAHEVNIADEEPEHEPVGTSPERLHLGSGFAARFRKSRKRRGWVGDEDDDIVDHDSEDSEDDGSVGGNEDIRDILHYGEMLEYGDSSDEDDDDDDDDDDADDDLVLPNYKHTNALDEDMADEQDDAEYDTDMILDATPPRVRHLRLLRLKRQQQQRQQNQQKTPSEPLSRLPTFQRARMFVAARKPTDVGEAGREEEEEQGDSIGRRLSKDDSNNGDNGDNGDNSSQDAFATPARRRHYDALLHVHVQPPPDLFSPQKKQRRRQKQKQNRKGRGNAADETGDELVSPSAAAAAAAAAAINAPEQYVPGGLAAGLRDWLVQIKSGGGGVGGSSSGDGRGPNAVRCGVFHVAETRTAPGMCLAVGQKQRQQEHVQAAADWSRESRAGDEALDARLLLAGEGMQKTTDADTNMDAKSTAKRLAVTISHPAWEVVLGGQSWIVASDWSMNEA